ncbi:MAG: hypothetical protein M0P70_17900, partial [Desulfobulbaceae bacterium]|nr:hypothetical protein [Desulfobulbaceae bacterium]
MKVLTAEACHSAAGAGHARDRNPAMPMVAGKARSFYEPTTVKHYFVSPLDYLNRRVEERRDHKDLEAQ